MTQQDTINFVKEHFAIGERFLTVDIIHQMYEEGLPIEKATLRKVGRHMKKYSDIWGDFVIAEHVPADPKGGHSYLWERVR